MQSMRTVSPIHQLYPNADTNHEIEDTLHLLSKPITDQCFHAVIVRAEASELDFLRVLDLFGITVTPFNGDFGVCIRIYKDVEGAVTI